MTCVRCTRWTTSPRRGLCSTCYRAAFGNGTLTDYPRERAGVTVHDPHDHDCPVCPGGGLVAPYQADEHGRVTGRICLGRAHVGDRRLELEAAR